MTKPDMIKKAKQVGFIAVVALGAIFLMNTFAKRNQTVAAVQQKIATGA
mgnify:CR=1 FL=1